MIKRIGFACKLIDNLDQVDGIKPTDDCKRYNTSTTTAAWLNRQTKDVAVNKLWELMQHNIESARLLVEKVGTFDENLRMVRLSSDLLAMYTEPSWRWFYQQSDVRDYCQREFLRVGNSARQNNVRISFHPGQWCVLASSNPEIVTRSLEEFEYHVAMASWMDFGRRFQDIKINIHLSGKQGTQGFRDSYQRLSPEARNCITIENDEISYGLEDCLSISDIVPIVLDLHHNWVKEGTYIDPNSDSIKRVVDSWRGVRPTMHYSVSREDYLIDHDPTIMLDHSKLLSQGFKKSKLRAHSDGYWNMAINQWALNHLDWADIMCESKSKNLASAALYQQAKELNFL